MNDVFNVKCQVHIYYMTYKIEMHIFCIIQVDDVNIVFLQSVLWIIFSRRDTNLKSKNKISGKPVTNPVLETPRDTDSLHKELLKELQKGQKKRTSVGQC